MKSPRSGDNACTQLVALAMAILAISGTRQWRAYALLECITSGIGKCIGRKAGKIPVKKEWVKKKISV